MKEKMILQMLGLLWEGMLRDAALAAVNNTESEIDDIILGVLDRLFSFKSE